MTQPPCDPAGHGLLTGKVVLVTGASRGIGARIARRFAECGAKVAVNYRRSRDAAEGVADGICQVGGQAIVVQADVREPGPVADMVNTVTERLGPPDTLVLNADAGGFRPEPVTALDATAYQVRLQDEMSAAVMPVRAVLPGMIARRRGSIVAISSALCRAPVPGFSVLGVSKAALEAFVRALAVEAGPHGIRVNTVEASMIEGDNSEVVDPGLRAAMVDRVPLRRIGRPDDVAGVAALVASDIADFVNGATVPVNGGQVLY